MSEEPNAPDAANGQAALEEQLVAYLDGELSDAESRRVEELVAADPGAREAMTRLERTWGLLDRLDRSQVGEGFTHTTLEMLAVAAAEDAETLKALAPRRKIRRRLIGGLVLAGCALTGYLALSLSWPDPDGQLLRDLRVVENFDEYRQIDDIKFLRRLYHAGLFKAGPHDNASKSAAPSKEEKSATSAADVPAREPKKSAVADKSLERSTAKNAPKTGEKSPSKSVDEKHMAVGDHKGSEKSTAPRNKKHAGEHGEKKSAAEKKSPPEEYDDEPELEAPKSVETLAERRAWVEALSAAEKEQLLDHWRRFQQLKPEEQDRLRRLHEAIERDPRGDELRQVMLHYCEWFKTREAYERAELAGLTPADRVAEIKRMVAGQPLRIAAGRGGRAESEWLARHERLSAKDAKGLVAWIDQCIVRRHDPFPENVTDPEEREELQKELKSIKDPGRRHELLALMWLRWQLDHNLENPPKDSPLSDKGLAELRGKLSPPTRQRLETKPAEEQWRLLSQMVPMWLVLHQNDEELAEFLDSLLTPADRDRLLSLPRDQFFRELWRRYVRWKVPETPPEHEGKRPPVGRSVPAPTSAKRNAPSAKSATGPSK
jgi:hypothetical protein